MAHWHDIEELAQIVLGLDSNADSDEIEQVLYDKYEISFDSFARLVGQLSKMTPPAQAGFTGKSFTGFVHDGAFIVKQPQEET